MIKKIIFPILVALVLFACSGDDRDNPINANEQSSSSSAVSTAINKARIYGVAQKGPFQGAVVTVYELDGNLKKVRPHYGKTDRKGYFEVEIANGKLASPYIIIEAEGYYANEVTGNPSTSMMTLKAVADVSDKDNVNINVLTHLEHDKVLELAKSGKSFESSKTQAQKEVLNTLGIKESVTRNSEDMALFGGNPSDNVLLTVSVSLQNNRTTDELSDLLSDLGGSAKFDVEKELASVNLGKVRDNILSIEPTAKLPEVFPALTPSTSGGTGSKTGSSTGGSTSGGSGYSGGSVGGSSTPTKPSTPSTPSSSSASISQCGKFDPASQYCENGVVKEMIKCVEKDYNPTTHFCTRAPDESKRVVVERCGGKGYDTRTKYCVGNEIKEKEINLCDGFINGATRLHEGKYKKQFCDPRDGTKYVYVNIGTQTWMAENLRYSAEGSKCGNYDDNSLSDANTANCDTYGRIYNWSTAMNGSTSSAKNPSGVQGVCPAGWHLPSDAEWTTLTNFVGGETTAGTKLKADSPLWKSNGKGTDEVGFSALPGGRYYSAIFGGVGFYGDWWSATEYNASSAYSRDMFYGGDVHGGHFDKTDLYSVRCVQDYNSNSSSDYAPIEISNFTFSDIQYWVGSGTDSAMLIIQWNDGKKPEALAYGYRWEAGQRKSGNDMIIDIAKADKRFFYLKYSGVIGGIGFNASGEAKIGIDGGSCQSPADGSVETHIYNFDSWKICNDADARWFAGWYDGYWGYYTSENANRVLNYSEVEASSRVLKNKSIDAWNAMPGFSKFPLSAITPISIPSSSSVVPSSSSSEQSSSSTILSSSSEVVSSSSSAVGGGGLCAGFTEGTKREHQGKEKEQFCDPRDGTKYVYVEIGAQTWMAENLNFEADGSKCGSVLTGSGTIGDANTETCDTYGRLYNWSTAMNGSLASSTNPSGVQGVCPSGWHLPSKVEWTTLTAAVGDGPGGKLKGSTLWSSGTSTDDYGFAALPSGFGNDDNNFNNVRTYSYWWSTTETSTQATYLSLRNTNTSAATADTGNKNFFYSVRCVKN
jgi:uncharacterized protein (TIGR02145 family)